jgi:hypothetical protein
LDRGHLAVELAAGVGERALLERARLTHRRCLPLRLRQRRLRCERHAELALGGGGGVARARAERVERGRGQRELRLELGVELGVGRNHARQLRLQPRRHRLALAAVGAEPRARARGDRGEFERGRGRRLIGAVGRGADEERGAAGLGAQRARQQPRQLGLAKRRPRAALARRHRREDAAKRFKTGAERAVLLDGEARHARDARRRRRRELEDVHEPAAAARQPQRHDHVRHRAQLARHAGGDRVARAGRAAQQRVELRGGCGGGKGGGGGAGGGAGKVGQRELSSRAEQVVHSLEEDERHRDLDLGAAAGRGGARERARGELARGGAGKGRGGHGGAGRAINDQRAARAALAEQRLVHHLVGHLPPEARVARGGAAAVAGRRDAHAVELDGA